MKTRAFTLIELLVVIAVIGILAALILSVTKVVGQSRDQTAALSNLRQVGLAVNLYTNDNSFALPRRVQTADDEQGGKWPSLLARYLNNDYRVYAALGVPNYITKKQDPLSNSQNHTSFIMNGFNDQGAYHDPSKQLRLNQFNDLSNLILFGMQIDTDNFYMDFEEGNQKGVLKLDAYNGGSVYLFADGSSRLISKVDYSAVKPGMSVRYGDWLWLTDKSYEIPNRNQ